MGAPRRSWPPESVHGTLALALAGLATLAALYALPWRWSGTHVLLCWLLSVNLVTFAYYGYDKRCARQQGRRVPESVLHGLSIAGGSHGAWAAMRTFRHKTIKGRFRFVFWSIVFLQAVLLCWLAWWYWQARS